MPILWRLTVRSTHCTASNCIVQNLYHIHMSYYRITLTEPKLPLRFKYATMPFMKQTKTVKCIDRLHNLNEDLASVSDL